MIPIKNDREVGWMREAGRAAASVLGKLVSSIKPGVSTGEIDALAAELIREEGCSSAFLGYRGFPGNICISLNEEVVHGIGGTRRIQYGDIVKLDVGVVKGGWVGDTATTLGVGALPSDLQALLDVTERALAAGIAEAVAGRRLGDLCSAIEEVVVASGMSVVRDFVGHGVGRKLHEEPQIPNYGKRGTGPKLKAGMTLAIEPMVNLGGAAVRVLEDQWTVVAVDGKPSAHCEHTVLVTKDAPEILTQRGV
jgi:methionyl aminopeptidase